MKKLQIAGKAVIAMVKTAKKAVGTEFKKELMEQMKNTEVKTSKFTHEAVTYMDDHTGQTETNKIYKVVLMNGKIGMAVAGTVSSINAFDFDSMELSRTSVGGNFYNRPQDGTLEEAVIKYNESVISEGIKIKMIIPA